MSILLDEQIDVRMKASLDGFRVFTVQDKGWVGVKNGVLRGLLNQENFRYFITADKNLPFQQNLQDVDFTIILLDTPTLLWEHQQKFVLKLIQLLSAPPEPPVKLIHVTVAGLSRGKKIESLRLLLPAADIMFA